jgi:hypothetical protein
VTSLNEFDVRPSASALPPKKEGRVEEGVRCDQTGKQERRVGEKRREESRGWSRE